VPVGCRSPNSRASRISSSRRAGTRRGAVLRDRGRGTPRKSSPWRSSSWSNWRRETPGRGRAPRGRRPSGRRPSARAERRASRRFPLSCRGGCSAPRVALRAEGAAKRCATTLPFAGTRTDVPEERGTSRSIGGDGRSGDGRSISATFVEPPGHSGATGGRAPGCWKRQPRAASATALSHPRQTMRRAGRDRVAALGGRTRRNRGKLSSSVEGHACRWAEAFHPSARLSETLCYLSFARVRRARADRRRGQEPAERADGFSRWEGGACRGTETRPSPLGFMPRLDREVRNAGWAVTGRSLWGLLRVKASLRESIPRSARV